MKLKKEEKQPMPEPTGEFLDYLKTRHNRNSYPIFCAEIGGRMHDICQRAMKKGYLVHHRSGKILNKSASMYYDMWRLAHHVSEFYPYLEAHKGRGKR